MGINYINRIQNEMHTGPHSFEMRRRQEWHNKVSPEIVYKYETESKAAQIAFAIFSVIIFPVGLAVLAHKFIGKMIFSGWWSVDEHRETCTHYFAGDLNGLNEKKPKLSSNFVSKKINILVNGNIVDAFICGRRENINNGKWRLVATGRNGCMEDIKPDYDQDKNWEQNTLYFNYSGVGASEGWPSKVQIINSFKAMIHFLEDSKNGIGAEQITCLGRSIGGGVLGVALEDHAFKKDITYTLIRDRSFSRLSDVFWYAKLAKLVGWEFDGVAASEKLEKRGINEIILQASHSSAVDKNLVDVKTVPKMKRLKMEDLYYEKNRSLKAEKIKHDGLIAPSSSLAYALLSKRTNWRHKKFISVSLHRGHSQFLSLDSCKKMDLVN